LLFEQRGHEKGSKLKRQAELCVWRMRSGLSPALNWKFQPMRKIGLMVAPLSLSAAA
jgi:hypothetical protein